MYNTYCIMNIKIQLLLFITISRAVAFIAYDCTGPHINITSFNSLRVDYCDPPPPTNSIEIQRIKLLQKAAIFNIGYKSCMITIDYIVMKCSMFDDAQMVEGGFFTEVQTIGSVRCAEMHQKLIYQSPMGRVFVLKNNDTTMASYTVVGSLDREGSCEGSGYTTDRGSWTNVVVQAKMTIKLSDGIAMANNKDNILIMPTGTRFKLTSAYGIDSYKGEVIWNNNEYDCDTHEFNVLYDGPASLIVSKPQNEHSDESHTYLVETEKIVFALKKIKKAFACEIPVIQTEHTQLYILVDPIFMNHFSFNTLSPYNIDLMAYVNTKFVYIENFLRSTVTSLYTDILMKQCDLERNILKQKLSMASHSLSEFAYNMGEGPGYSAMTGGEVIYLFRCTPVVVEVERQNTCYNELPVRYNNKTYFMGPKTHVLQQYGTEIDCNELLPSAYEQGDSWLGMAPTIREIKIPQTLKPGTKWTWMYKSPVNLISAGLYDQNSMNALQQHLMFPINANAAQNNLARQTMGYETVDNEKRIKFFIGQDTITKIVDEQFKKMWGFFTGFGNVVSGCLGLIFIWKILLSCFNAGLNISILYQTFGWSVKLVAGIFSSLTHYIMHKAHKNKYTRININGPNNELTMYPDLKNIPV